VHDVAHVPDFPSKSLRSGRKRDEGGGDKVQVAFSAGIPGGIQLSSLPDPRTVHEAMAAPDADGWRVAMDAELENLRSHEVYDLVPHAYHWVLHRKFKNGAFDKNNARLVARGNQQRLCIDYGESFPSNAA